MDERYITCTCGNAAVMRPFQAGPFKTYLCHACGRRVSRLPWLRKRFGKDARVLHSAGICSAALESR